MQKNFSDFASNMQHHRKTLTLLKIIVKDKYSDELVLDRYHDQDLHKIISNILFDESARPNALGNRLDEEVESSTTLLKELNSAVKEKNTLQEDTYHDLEKKKKELFARLSNIIDEKAELQTENARMIIELKDYLKKREWLALKRDYINFKYSEYGDEDKINAMFQQWSKEYEESKAEGDFLKTEHDKAVQNEKIIPRVYTDTKIEIKKLRDEMDRAKFEMDSILKAYPDIRELAKESQDIVIKYKEVHEELERTTKSISELRANFEKVSNETETVRKELGTKKDELAPSLRIETAAKTKLADLMHRFNRQEELYEENRVFQEVIGPLETKLEGWRKKIKDYEVKSTTINKEIDTLKSENRGLSSELKEYEEIVGPVKELKSRLDKAEEGIKQIEEQDQKFTTEVKTLKKENDMLSIKARQFEMIKKKLEEKI